MKITDFCVKNSAGKKIPADPFGNNLAFTCFLCGHPVLLGTFLSGQGKDKNNQKECRRKICNAKYFMEVREEDKTVIIHTTGDSSDILKEIMESDDSEGPEIGDRDFMAERQHVLRACLKQSAEIERLHNKLLDYLCDLIPDKPNKELKKTNPSEYKTQKTIRNAAKKELGTLVIWVKNELADERDLHKWHLRWCHSEREKRLMQQFPQLRDPEKRNNFYDVLRESGSMFGFSEEEVVETHDPRVLILLYYAWMGKKSEIDDKKKLN